MLSRKHENSVGLLWCLMATKKYYMGIDPGMNGGIVVLDSNHTIISKTIMPTLGGSKKEYDIQELYNFLIQFSSSNDDIKTMTILEKSQPHFHDGRKQAFKTGYGYGVLQGLLTALKISFQIEAPKTWQKKIFEGLESDDTKSASILFCKRKWPTEIWTATNRCSKAHDGMTDAACMAYYGVMLHNQS